MKIKIKLFATLRNFGPDEQEIDLPENATVGDAIELLRLPEGIPMLKIVNGEHRNLKYHLKEGDEVALFPPIAGGRCDYSNLVNSTIREKCLNLRRDFGSCAGAQETD